MTEKKGLRKVIDIILWSCLVWLGIQLVLGNLDKFGMICLLVGIILSKAPSVANYKNSTFYKYRTFKNGYKTLMSFHVSRQHLYLANDRDGMAQLSTLINRQGNNLLILGKELLTCDSLSQEKRHYIDFKMCIIHTVMVNPLALLR